MSYSKKKNFWPNYHTVITQHQQMFLRYIQVFDTSKAAFLLELGNLFSSRAGCKSIKATAEPSWPDILISVFFRSYSMNFSWVHFKVLIILQYNLRVFFFYPTHLSGADCFTHCNPIQGSSQTLPVILWHAHCDPPAISPKWVESQWAIKL